MVENLVALKVAMKVVQKAFEEVALLVYVQAETLVEHKVEEMEKLSFEWMEVPLTIWQEM